VTWNMRGWLCEQRRSMKILDQLIPQVEFGPKLMHAYVELPADSFVGER